MKRNIILLLLFIVSFSLQAQPSARDINKEINNIKRNTDYIWAEATEVTKEKAEEAAMVSLTLAIKDLLPQLDLETIKEKVSGCQQMHMLRGTMHRVFVYINKDLSATGSAKPYSALAESVNQTFGIRTSDSTSNAPIGEVANDSSLSQWQQNFINGLVKCADVNAVVNYLDKMKVQNKVTQIGTKSNQPRSPEKAFYVFFDSDLNLKAVLGKEVGGKRLNYITNNQESIKDYSNNAFMWFVLPN